jgi:hypothetical protein
MNKTLNKVKSEISNLIMSETLSAEFALKRFVQGRLFCAAMDV